MELNYHLLATFNKVAQVQAQHMLSNKFHLNSTSNHNNHNSNRSSNNNSNNHNKLFIQPEQVLRPYMLSNPMNNTHKGRSQFQKRIRMAIIKKVNILTLDLVLPFKRWQGPEQSTDYCSTS